MTIATTFKPEYIERRELGPAAICAAVSPALDDVGCTDKQIDFHAHRMLAKAVSGDYVILCWWAAEQEDAISDGKPMYTINKEDATLLGIGSFPRTGKSGDADAIARLNARLKASIEHYLQAHQEAQANKAQQS
jgi:hypothetical protein